MLPVPAGGTTVSELPDPLVPRAELLAALHDDDSDTVLVCAPARFGETALLVQWARAAAPVVAWADLNSYTGDHIWPVLLAGLIECPKYPRIAHSMRSPTARRRHLTRGS